MQIILKYLLYNIWHFQFLSNICLKKFQIIVNLKKPTTGLQAHSLMEIKM